MSMSHRLHTRGMRRGYQHNRQGAYGRQGGHWGPRGGGQVNRPDYRQQQHNRGDRDRPPRSGPRQADPEQILASLGPDAQLALTKAIINTVLKTKEGKESRGDGGRNHRGEGYEEYQNSDNRREGHGGYPREEMRPRRPYGEPRRYDRWHNEEGRGHHYEQGNGPPRNQYDNRYPSGSIRRRLSSPSHPGPSYKRQRMERLQSSGGDREGYHKPGMNEECMERGEHPRERHHRNSSTRNEQNHHNMDGMEGEGGPRSGVQVTIRADGERAVNSDGHVRRVPGRPFIELKCPHCNNQKSITFKEYKMHLRSDHHRNQLQKLARKHTAVLRKIRGQQRQEQRDIENKWNEENNEEFKTSVSRFCNLCKLSFKCPVSNINEGITQHKRSKLHNMQRHYLHPRCGWCRITYKSRLDYELHVASINHLKYQALAVDNQGNNKQDEQNPTEEEGVDLDLANFMTVDFVGDDDEDDKGSEHEEITGGMDVTQAQEKQEAEGEDDLDAISEPSSPEKDIGKRREMNKKVQKDEYNEEKELDDDALDHEWEKDQPEDEEEEERQPLGKEYVQRIEAYYCSICFKVIRADSSLGSRAIQRHCRSFTHISRYRDQHPNLTEGQEEDCANGREGENEAEADLDEEPYHDKLWEEVDKGLTALEGEIMTEIENDSAIEEKEAVEVKGDEEEEEPNNEEMDKPEVEPQNINTEKKEQQQQKHEVTSHEDQDDEVEEVGEDFNM